MDLIKEREAFQKFLEDNFDLENHEYTYFDEKTQCYENGIGEDIASINMAWEVWKEVKSQVLDGFVLVEKDLLEDCISHCSLAECHPSNRANDELAIKETIAKLEKVITGASS